MLTVWEALGRALSPVEERPRVAPDMEWATYTGRGGKYVVAHNPAVHTYVRLDPREFELVELMDGTRSLKELVITYYQRNGVLALARVAGLVQLLREQRFLVEGSTDAYARLAAIYRRSGQSRRAAELTTTAADPVLHGAYQSWGKFFFNRAWLIIGLVLGLLGPLLVVIELVRGRYTLYDVGGSPGLGVMLLVFLALAALAIHELGHGLAVEHAGRRVHQAGLRLYFGLPTAYVDTSDIWMAPPRQRLLTAFAGPWTGLTLGGLFAIGAAVVADTAGAGAFLFAAAFVFLVDNLFNFNPLLELDGYYMLIDFLDRPLLRARSMAFVRGPLWSRLWGRQPLEADERLLAVFGIGSALYAVVAIVLALRAWQSLLLPLIVRNLGSPEPVGQLIGLLLIIVIAVVVLIGLFALVRAAAAPFRGWLNWLSGRAAERRHRDALAALRAVPLLSGLPGGRLFELARAMEAADVARGAEVVRQGEAGDCFYLIAEGAFEVFVDGRPEVRLGPGDFFGERALLHRAPRAATVVATRPGRVFVLDRAAFDALLASDLAARERIENAIAYRDALAEMPLFSDLSPGELDVLVSRMTPLQVGEGEVVLRQGEMGDRFYVVESGRLNVWRNREILAQLGPGDAFGEIALLLNVPRTATVTAETPSKLLALEAADFRDILAGYLGRGTELERLSNLRLLSHKRLDEVV